MRILCVSMLVLILLSCSAEQKPAERKAAAPVATAPRPADESRRFPPAGLIETRVVETQLAGKPFMPGGTAARYRRGKSEYEMFVAKAASPTAAAIALSDWRKSMTDPKLVAAFGGYYGQDNGTPTFVFTKGDWIAGVRGLSEKQVDLPARTLAARLD